MDKVSDSSVGGNQVLVNVEVHREQDDNSDSDVQSGQVNFNYVMKMIHRKIHCSVILICRMMILIMMMLSKQNLLCANQSEIKNQLKDSHSFMTTIKYKKMKVNHGGEVWHVLNICVFLIAIKLNKPN